MPADPIDPGAMPIAVVGLTNSQLRQLAAAVEGNTGSVLVEQLTDAYARVVLVGPDGDAVRERLLFPT